jgi:hypothetical protein
MLFGKERIDGSNGEIRKQTSEGVLQALLAEHGGALRLTLARLSDDEVSNLFANDPHLHAERTDADSLLLGSHPQPLLHQRLAILTSHDIALWREARVDPGRDRKLQEGFFSNRSWDGTPMEDVTILSAERALLERLLTGYRERGAGKRFLSLVVEQLPERDELRRLFDLTRLKLVDSLNLQPTAANQLKEALLRVTQSSLHPARIVQDCLEVQLRRPSQAVSMLDLLEASIAFALKVEAVRAGALSNPPVHKHS